jgi:hypothetical protein
MTDLALADAPLARDLVPTDRRLLPCALEDLNAGADIIQEAGGFVSKELRADRGACVAVAYMAALHGTDLIGTASQAYSVGGRLAFMAQYINALVQRHLDARPVYAYQGQAGTRAVMVTATPRGGQPLTYASPQVGQIKVKNSPLWATDPDQQLAYYGIRAWARRHMPDVLLGIYAVEELQAVVIRDVTPAGPDPFAAMEQAIEDAEVDAGPFETSGGFTTDTEGKAADIISPATADDPLAWFEEVKLTLADVQDEETLDALFIGTEADRRALWRADKAASADLDRLFSARQREIRAAV